MRIKLNYLVSITEVVDPIVLGVNIFEKANECCCCCCAHDIPDTVVSNLSGNLCYDDDDKCRYLAVSLGIFSVVRIVRPAQYLVAATEYVIPDKECISPSNDDPCSVFRAMSFPVSEFSCNCVSSNHNHDKGNPGKCGCGNN